MSFGVSFVCDKTPLADPAIATYKRERRENSIGYCILSSAIIPNFTRKCINCMSMNS